MTNWTSKPKIAAASGILGLFIGIGAGGQTDEDAAAAAKDQSRALVQKAEASADARVEQAEASADERVAEASADAEPDDAAIAAAVADAVAAERSKRKRLIAAAVTKAVDQVKASAPEPKTLVDAGASDTDPRFDTCGAANAAGYGNYRQGIDPEYNWYQDRDGDGSVCE